MATIRTIFGENLLQYLVPKVMLFFAIASKFWRAKVTRAPGAMFIALRCALLAPRTVNNYTHVVNLLKKAIAGSVHPPSPLRLLRFACANRCEIGACQIAGGRRALVGYAKLPYGMFACWKCTKSHSAAAYGSSFSILHSHARGNFASSSNSVSLH